jgi:CheY-like chemotaxis protein
MHVLVIDDHALIREALRGVLKDLDPDATVLEASGYRQAARLLEAHPDLGLILLDLNLPDRDGFAVLVEFRERYPATSIVMLSGFNDHDNVVKALNLGALGFIPKSAERTVMLGALNLVLAGGTYIPSDVLDRQGATVADRGPAVGPTGDRCARVPRADPAASRCPRPPDAGSEQQGHLPEARPRRADGEEQHHRHFQSPAGEQPHRGGDQGREAGLGSAEARVTASAGASSSTL